MHNTQNLGKKIRELRMNNNLTMEQLATRAKIHPTLLSKIENGSRKPSITVIRALSSELNLNETDINYLLSLISASTPFEQKLNNNSEGEEVKKSMDEFANKKNPIEVKVPDNLPVLYSDVAMVTSSPYGIVFDFAQNVGPTTTRNVVSRVGISVEHAKALLQVLSKKIVDAEKARTEKEKEDNIKANN
ncbi:MAG TPA: DUF3467 domain-containing protein [Patescibacteria group bacterium]|nr:DUF3467 domain-containing protein [Patescibacteria group bacterium]